MFSIDQNCHSLWDALPKLQALAARGAHVRHFVEDIDVAFTSLGLQGRGGPLRWTRERFHPSGGQDWGAALFYSEFLGKLCVEIRDWEPLTGMKTAALARQLGCGLESLYQEFSAGDNWQLIGPSYLGDGEHHRVIGDLTVAETREFLCEMIDTARRDMQQAFPERPCQQRLAEWFAAERALLDRLLDRHAGARLVDLYRDWMGQYLEATSVRLDWASSLCSCGADPNQTALLELWLADYERMAGLYNGAIERAQVPLRGLKTTAGELPFFVTGQFEGHLARAAVHLRGEELLIGGQEGLGLLPGRRLPIERMRAAGVSALSGKAMLLVIQARLQDALAVPYGGSLYMPAVHLLADSLVSEGLLPGKLHPVVRVRFRLLDRMATLKTVVRLPAHLAEAFGKDEIPASELAGNWRSVQREARQRLAAMTDAEARRRFQQGSFPALSAGIDELNLRRRTLAGEDPKSSEIRELSKRVKALQVEILDRTFRQIARDWQVAHVETYDSRGALLPWSIALGGEEFYNELIQAADVFEENEPTA